MSAITLKVDKFGRILIPQEIRNRLGILEGGALELQEEKGMIQLFVSPTKNTNYLKKKSNILIYTGKLENKKAILDFQKKMREGRINYLQGLK
ncbi:MAG: AbrB/MazE/SpoVT family DNA-binding domain-containing protein [Leptospiraceae bacterium]|nr:AbrB/MazE/SpoVT family DNA-binding domain-containing protein [Leptospiraceae bacterium]